jgi:hypothetical protein
MLMGMGGASSHFTGFSVIDNQALIMLIGLHGESFPGTTLRLSFARRTGAEQPVQSGACQVRIMLLLLNSFTPFRPEGIKCRLELGVRHLCVQIHGLGGC